MMQDLHPCFNGSVAGQWGRIHLPVAPECNISCAYCNRRTDCVNEARPGVCSRLLSPEEAADRVDEAVRQTPWLAVAGIAGPGDPLADADLALRTFELVRRRHPELLLCLSTNGLRLADYAEDLKALGVGHITVTINAVRPEVAERVCLAVTLDGRVHYGRAAAELLVAGQEKALARMAGGGFAVKVNTVVIAGVNDDHVEDIARHAARFGVGLMNCIGLIPVPGTAMSAFTAPSAGRMAELRERAGQYVAQMRHCARCRSDASGLLAPAARPSGQKPGRSIFCIESGAEPREQEILFDVCRRN